MDGPNVEEFRSGAEPPWEGQQRGFQIARDLAGREDSQAIPKKGGLIIVDG